MENREIQSKNKDGRQTEDSWRFSKVLKAEQELACWEGRIWVSAGLLKNSNILQVHNHKLSQGAEPPCQNMPHLNPLSKQVTMPTRRKAVFPDLSQSLNTSQVSSVAVENIVFKLWIKLQR